jgi:acyl-CoA thioester hydrolase
MYTHSTSLRVRYSETDQMSFVYYGQYAAYFEVGRVEAMRSLGIRYAAIENDHGILMPVMNMHVRYLRPALYDDHLTLKTSVTRLPEKDIIFLTEIFLEDGKLAVVGKVTLCFLEAGTRKRIPVPQFLIDVLKPSFD